MPFVSLGYFPSCFTPTNDGSLVGLGTSYPFGFSLNDLMTVYWKQNWNEYVIRSNISYLISVPPNSAQITGIYETNSGGYYTPVPSFKDLSCPKTISLQNQTDPAVQLTIQIFPNGYIYNGYYFPNMVVQIFCSAVVEGDAGYQNVLMDCENVFTEAQIDSIIAGQPTYKKLKVAFTMDNIGINPYFWGYGFTVGAGTGSFDVSTFSVGPSSYWDYPA